MRVDPAKVIVVKLGGSTLGNHDTSLEDLVSLQRSGMRPVVVHGGGNLVTEWLKKMGIETKFVKGRRVTDAESLKVVTAVLAGLVNKELIAALTAMGGKAFGMSGAEGGFITARVDNPELGLAGEPDEVDPTPLLAILKAGYIPLISPLCLRSAKDGRGVGLLNVNGDSVAAEVARVLDASKLIFLTDVAGVCDSSGKVFTRLSTEDARALIASGVISGGMVPKIEASLRAVSASTVARIVDGRVVHALLKEVRDGRGGTTIGRTK